MGIGQDNADLEAAPLWCGHVWVTPVVPQMCRGTELLLRDTPFTTSNPKEFWLDNIQGYICSTVSITIPPFMAVNIHCKMDALGPLYAG